MPWILHTFCLYWILLRFWTSEFFIQSWKNAPTHLMCLNTIASYLTIEFHQIYRIKHFGFIKGIWVNKLFCREAIFVALSCFQFYLKCDTKACMRCIWIENTFAKYAERLYENNLYEITVWIENERTKRHFIVPYEEILILKKDHSTYMLTKCE